MLQISTSNIYLEILRGKDNKIHMDLYFYSVAKSGAKKLNYLDKI